MRKYTFSDKKYTASHDLDSKSITDQGGYMRIRAVI